MSSRGGLGAWGHGATSFDAWLSRLLLFCTAPLVVPATYNEEDQLAMQEGQRQELELENTEELDEGELDDGLVDDVPVVDDKQGS